MRGVDIALQRLQIIAVALNEECPDLAVGNVQNLESRQRRRFGARPHIDPDQPGAFDRPVRLGADLVLEVLMRRHVRHVEAVAGHVEFPAVIDAADPALLVAAQEQRRAAVRAAMIHDADPALAVAKGDQLLAEQHQAKRRAAALNLGGHQRGDPVFPHQLTHDGAGPDPSQFNAFDRRCHRALLMLAAGSSGHPAGGSAAMLHRSWACGERQQASLAASAERC